MEIDKDKIQKIIEQMEASEQPFYDACTMLKELINEKWEPKIYKQHWWIKSFGVIAGTEDLMESATAEMRLYGNEFPTKELAETARDMNKRNQLILQAKHEMGYKDGDFIITCKEGEWMAHGSLHTDNPELTFKTYEQAEKIISMVGLND